MHFHTARFLCSAVLTAAAGTFSLLLLEIGLIFLTLVFKYMVRRHYRTVTYHLNTSSPDVSAEADKK